MTFPAIDSLDTYGGAKANYAPIVDPTTDRDADDANQAYASTAAMTHTATQAWARFVTSATTPTLAVTNSNDAAWGNSAPDQPTPGRSSTGVFTLTWPTTVVDELGVTHTVNLRWARASIEGSSLGGFVQCAVTAPNVVTVYTFNTSFSANDLVGKTVFVQAG